VGRKGRPATTEEVARAISPYRELLEQFVRGELAADDFVAAYWDVYLNMTMGYSTAVFEIVDGFFAEVDAYVEDPDLRTEIPESNGPEELLVRARDLLRRAGVKTVESGDSS